MLSTLVGIAHALLLFCLIRFLLPTVRSAPLARVFVPALVYKVAMGWLLGAIFFFYYRGGDTIHYFNDASLLAQLAYHNPTEYFRVLVGWQAPPSALVYLNQPRALFFDKLLSVVAIFSYRNYWIGSVYLSLLSFGGCWKLANALSRRFPQHRAAAAAAFLFYPSVVFWSAGILKESVAVAAITLMVCQTLKLTTHDHTPKSLVRIILSLGLAGWMLWELKYYYAVVLIPMLISIALTQQLMKHEATVVRFATILIGWAIGGTLLSLLHPLLGIDNLANLLLHKHDTMVLLSDSSYIIHFVSLDGSVGKFLVNAPWALFSGLFRPLVGEGSTLLQWIAALENTGLLLLTAGALVHGRWNRASPSESLWVFATLLYIATLAVMLAFVSPNFGSLVRYRVAFLPFLVYLVLAGNPWFQSLFSRRNAVSRA